MNVARARRAAAMAHTAMVYLSLLVAAQGGHAETVAADVRDAAVD